MCDQTFFLCLTGSSRIRRRGRNIKEISYKNSYDKISVVIEDDDVEGLEEVIHFLNDNARIIDNLENKERYHMAYHIEGLIYEGTEYAADEDVVSNVARTEIEQMIDE